jgi:hypothetical protein
LSREEFAQHFGDNVSVRQIIPYFVWSELADFEALNPDEEGFGYRVDCGRGLLLLFW